jgi:hypothetical protein
MTLGDVFNSPTAIPFEGVEYRLRQPTLMEQGEYQRWLEQRAYEAIERRDYRDPDHRERDRRNLNNDVAAGVFEWGGEVCVRAVQTPGGLARLLSVICRDQGLTEQKAKGLVDLKVREIAAVLVARATKDPNSLRAVLATLGLPETFLSSDSSTPHSGETSTSSGGSARPSCSDSTPSSATPTAPPG